MLEKLLRAVAPGIAASRAEAELRLARADRARQVLMTYDAARQGGRHAGWQRNGTSAVAEIGGAIGTLRAGARELVRNNPHAARVIRVLEAQIAGKGTKPRCQGDDEAARVAAKAAWDRFVETCDADGRTDWYGQQRLMTRTVVESGEALRVWIPRRQSSDLVWQCRILEGDHLDHLKTEERSDGTRVVQGVEFDADGRRVAYWLHDRHPGDRFALASRLASRRVDAALVDHIFETLRPGQVRGVSWFAPVALVLRDVGELAEAELVRKKVEACIAMIITNTQPRDDDTPAIAGASDDAAAGGFVRNAAGQIVERLSPGMVLQASEGWGAEFMAPSASEGLVDHMMERLHAVAAGVGITFHQMTGNLSNANYSSMRAGLIDFYALLDSWQDELIIQQSARPAWRRVMQAARMSGSLRDAPPVAWQRPVRPWVDPLKDMQAREMELRLGLQSHQNIIEDLGRDPEEIVRERGEWAALMGGGNVEAAGAVLSQDDEAQGGGEAPPESIGGVDPEIYGRAVRAGAITPQREDEDFFRKAIGLPAAGANVDAAWRADGGFRSPVTIKSKGEAGAAARAADDGADS